jgi:hypothetical protein
VLGLMGSVVPEQQWGLGSVEIPEATYVGFKAGWGPEGSASGPYLVRQSGIVQRGDGSGFAVTLMAESGSGSFDGGVATLDQLAAWLAENIGPKTFGSC